MYKTSNGVRTLAGAERELFAASVAMLTDFLSDGNDYDAGIAVFDALQRNQKIAVLHGVFKALVLENVRAPRLTAIIEGTVAVVFENINDQVETELACLDEDDEVDDEGLFSAGDEPRYDGPTWREQIHQACREVIDHDLPEVASTDQAEWKFLIDCLSDRILWDQDWAMVGQLDANPELGARLKQELGVDEDYFVSVPPDPTDEEAERLLKELRRMTPEGRNL